MAYHRIVLTVNGTKEQVDVPSNMTLLRMLREKLALTGTKNGCAAGECGACTVMMNGEPVNSCMVLAAECDGAEIITVEGLANDRQLDPIQAMMMETGGVQCGFCTPGILITARALVGPEPEPQRIGDSRGVGGQPVPLHGLFPDHRRGQESRACGSEVNMATKTSDNPIAPVGESVTRLDARAKVTGSATYADDFQFGPRLLHARAVRSPHPMALIKKVDTSEAEAMPGVKGIVTGKDFDGMLGLYLTDRYILCRDRVRYVGDPVAVVAAETVEIAEEAVKKIKVEYEVLPPVLDPEEGIKPGATVVHPDLGNYAYPNFIFPEAGTNIANRFKVRKGDVDEGFKKCAAIVERKYKVPHIQHVPIEPHVSVAKWDEDGHITLWTSSQSPFAQRNLIAKALHVSQGSVEVIAPYVGGGFGAKAGVSMESLAVVVSSKTKGRPVKLVLTREEEFHAAFCRQGLVAHYKMGCDKDGNLIAVDNKYYWDAGAYTEYGVNITRASGYSSTGPYRVPNVRVDSLCVYTNHPVGGPMRGFGMPEIHVGLEQCVDDLAHEIGMDPYEFRKKNCVKDGDIIVTGMKMHPTGLSKCIDEVAKAIDWGKKEQPTGPNKRRGKGMAIMWKAPAMPPNPGSSAEVKFNEDGTVDVAIGGQELGQGTFTVMAQMVASALGDSLRMGTYLHTHRYQVQPL